MTPPRLSPRYTSRMRPLTVGLALLFAVLAQPAVPQTASGAYDVEVVIFRTGANSPEAVGDPGDRFAGGGDSADPAAGSGVARLVGSLPAARLQLTGIAERLRTRAGLRVIAHTGWSQTPSPWGLRSGYSLARLGITAEGLSGTVFLERGQYLHLGFAISLGSATISEIRRVRPGEKNYFDNPDFGVIAVVSATR